MPKYLKQNFDPATLDSLADFVCGDDVRRYPEYRSSSYLTRFFQNIDIDVTHDGTTRKWWALMILQQLTLNDIEKVVLRLVDIREYKADKTKLEMATKSMNDILFMENLRVDFNGRDPVIVSLKTSTKPIITTNQSNELEEEFLKKEFDNNDLSKLGLESVIEVILKERIRESRQGLTSKAPLSSIIMAGSTLEGLLLGMASKFPKEFNQAVSTPKDKNGKARPFQDWTLEGFINVSHENGLIGLDVKKFSHALRDFRNYIHPYEQASSNFTPDEHTAKICLQVLNATIEDIIKFVSQKK